MGLEVVEITFACGSAVTSYTGTLFERGWIEKYTLTVPNFTNAVSSTISIVDEDGKTIYTNGGLAENTTHLVDPSPAIPIDKGYIPTLTLAGAAGGSGGDVVFKGWVRT